MLGTNMSINVIQKFLQLDTSISQLCLIKKQPQKTGDKIIEHNAILKK